MALTATTVRAGDEVLVPGDPALTRTIADRKIDFWQWVFGQQLDDRQRAELRQLQAGEWGLRDREWKERWVHFLDGWRPGVVGGPASDRLNAGIRRAAMDSFDRADADAVGRCLLARSALAHNPDAIAMQVLLRRQQQFDQMMRIMSDAQARHHETMMVIIRNMGATSRDK
jgi:hypothetical protein